MIDLVITREVNVNVDDNVFNGLNKRFCKILSSRIDKMLGMKGSVNLIFVDDVRIRDINKEYRGKDCATDVISFAYLEGDVVVSGAKEFVVGDIYISVDTAAAQALDNAHSLEKELSVLFVHGMLHLFGFDHNDDAEEEEMEGWAVEVLG